MSMPSIDGMFTPCMPWARPPGFGRTPIMLPKCRCCISVGWDGFIGIDMSCLPEELAEAGVDACACVACDWAGFAADRLVAICVLGVDDMSMPHMEEDAATGTEDAAAGWRGIGTLSVASCPATDGSAIAAPIASANGVAPRIVFVFMPPPPRGTCPLPCGKADGSDRPNGPDCRR